MPILRGKELGNVEQTLSILADEAVGHRARTAQVESVRWYLHYLLWDVGRQWGREARGLTNYVTLLDELDRLAPANEPICLVTFNYDRFLDDALVRRGVDLSTIELFTGDHRFKLFKVHGSADWAAEVELDIPGIDEMNGWGAAEALIARAPWDISSRYHRVTEWPIGKIDGKPAAPLLVLPIKKKDRFTIPEADELLLEELLPKTTHLLIIGWRGEDELFAKLLRSSLQPGRALVVSGTDAGAIIDRLMLPGAVDGFSEGFSRFVAKRGADSLYSMPISTPLKPAT